MMRYRRIVSLLIVMLFTVCMMAQPVLAAFDDVSEDSWYGESVEYVFFNGLFKGVSDTKFDPEATMTRGMFVTVLYRMSREMSSDFPDPGFTDVEPDAYYQIPVFWASQNGLVNGMDEYTFSPDKPVTREQICKLLGLYCSYMDFTLPSFEASVSFTDADTISDYAVEWVDMCQRASLITGYVDGSFMPQGEATRAEVAAILYRLSQLMEEADYIIGPGNPSQDWRMILVNPWNSIPEGYVSSISLTGIDNYMEVDSRIYNDYRALRSAMLSAGLSLYINSAFRTNAYQQYLFANQVNKWLSYGYSRAEAEVRAAQWVAIPGTSEHELGLAIDFNMYMSNSTAVHTWLANNAHEYGFIYRYQEHKMAATGINPEAWHYRYVGRENAIRIRESGLCLEEYWQKYG